MRIANLKHKQVEKRTRVVVTEHIHAPIGPTNANLDAIAYLLVTRLIGWVYAVGIG